jgi:hypothetical protein
MNIIKETLYIILQIIYMVLISVPVTIILLIAINTVELYKHIKNRLK